ncbi:hypothetical protein F4677DRAFT_442106 [Hypoxylon crocopeplum]|nr:hypothetical protein F4677DRAFT_442106 [Hypoxylon crocopeplum]
MQLETIPASWDTTGRETVNILLMERVPTAEQNHDDEVILLRTHYGDGDDKLAEWCEIDQDLDPAFEEDLAPFLILNDPQIFDFGGNWKRDFLSTRQQLRENVIRAENKEEEVEAGVGMELQVMAVEAYLIVADREAFETDQLRILYLDASGNIVRHSRLAPEDVWIAREK